MIYIIKQEGLYQNKVNSSLVFTGNCKMSYYCAFHKHVNSKVQKPSYRAYSLTWRESVQIYWNKRRF